MKKFLPTYATLSIYVVNDLKVVLDRRVAELLLLQISTSL